MPRRYRLDQGEMPDLMSMAPKMRRKVLRQAARVVALEARRIVPTRSGLLRKSIQYSAPNDVTAKVRSKSPHAHLVHDGTQAHGIRAKSKESARAGWKFYRGSTRRTVKHPGAKADPYLDKARDNTVPEVEARMREVALEVLAAVAEGK